MNSNLNKHEEKEKKPITVSWQDGDTTHVQTTVIHKRVPSAGVILLTAFTFTVIGVFIASIVFLARFTEIKTIMSAITGSSDPITWARSRIYTRSERTDVKHASGDC